METNIRKATKNDLVAIYNLVIELAIYEKEPDAVSASLEDYEKNFEQGLFDALVIEVEKNIVGMMLYYMTYSTWKGRMLYLEDFVIQERYRKMGLGQLLYNRLLIEAKNKDAKLIKWQVLNWNEAAIKFYQKNNAIIEKTWWNCKTFLKNS